MISRTLVFWFVFCFSTECKLNFIVSDGSVFLGLSGESFSLNRTSYSAPAEQLFFVPIDATVHGSATDSSAVLNFVMCF